MLFTLWGSWGGGVGVGAGMGKVVQLVRCCCTTFSDCVDACQCSSSVRCKQARVFRAQLRRDCVALRTQGLVIRSPHLSLDKKKKAAAERSMLEGPYYSYDEPDREARHSVAYGSTFEMASGNENVESLCRSGSSAMFFLETRGALWGGVWQPGWPPGIGKAYLPMPVSVQDPGYAAMPLLFVLMVSHT